MAFLKKIKLIFLGGGKKIPFLINDVKSLENLIFGIHFVEKCLIWGVLTNFSKNVPFWGPYLSSKHFSYGSLNLSRQGVSLLSTHTTIFE